MRYCDYNWQQLYIILLTSESSAPPAKIMLMIFLASITRLCRFVINMKLNYAMLRLRKLI